MRGRPPPTRGHTVPPRSQGGGGTGAECPPPGSGVIYIWHLFGLRVGIAFVISSVMPRQKIKLFTGQTMEG